MRWLRPLVAAAAIALGLTQGAQAQAPFSLDGKTVRFLVAQAAGGISDTEMRLIADNIVRFLPGTPTIVVQNVVGAGGVRLLEFMSQLDPLNELTVAMIPSAIAFRSRHGDFPGLFDARATNFVGSLPSATDVFLVSAASNITTPDELRRAEVLTGMLQTGGGAYANAVLMKQVLGFQLTPVAGYDSMGTLALALARNEINGLQSPYSSFATIFQPLIDEGSVRLLFYTDLERRSDIPAPWLFDLPMTAEQESFLRTALTALSFSRPLVIPAGSDPAFVAAMRTAFDAMVADPAFLATAATLGVDLKPRTAADLTAAVERLYATPDATIAEIGTILLTD